MRQSICLSEILHNKWAYMIFGITLILFATYCYEYTIYSLNSDSDLPALAAETYDIGSFTVKNRVDVQGVTLFLLECHTQSDNLIIAYPRSLILSRYGNEPNSFPVSKNSIKVILCQFEPGFLLYNFQLGDDMTTDFSQNTYFFNTWYETDTLEYSVTNPESAQNAVLVRQLIPYLAISTIVILCLGAFYKLETKSQEKSKE